MDKESRSTATDPDAPRPGGVPPNVETDLAAAEFEALLDATVDAIIVIDHQGKIIRFNKAAETMFGYSSAEMLGRSINRIIHGTESERHDNYIRNYLYTGVRKIIGIGREVQAIRKDGSTFPAALSVGEVRIKNRVRFVGVMRDLTLEKEAEKDTLRHREQLMHVSRLTTMGEMAAAMAHEINQPLSAIATYTAACVRLLNQPEDNRQEVTAALTEIGTQAHRAGEIIQRIRHFTRSREFTRKTVNIRAMIEEITPLAQLDANANGVRLTINLSDELPDVTVDGIQIQQVVLNLLRNGVDAMAEVPGDQRSLTLNAYCESPQTVRVDISDRGHGVSDEVQEKLFTPFFTTKEWGMGMGLAISRSIITAHGGKLDCMNNADAGATFFFTLPTSVLSETSPAAASE